jgi:hypothetical protein
MAENQTQPIFNHVQIGSAVPADSAVISEEDEELIEIGAVLSPDGQSPLASSAAAEPIEQPDITELSADEDELPPMGLTQKIVIALAAIGVLVLAGFLIYYYVFSS